MTNKNDKVMYVGITNNLERREKIKGTGWFLNAMMDKMTRRQKNIGRDMQRKGSLTHYRFAVAGNPIDLGYIKE